VTAKGSVGSHSCESGYLVDQLPPKGSSPETQSMHLSSMAKWSILWSKVIINQRLFLKKEYVSYFSPS
jgi:hypothetical protein